jgi:hypothetical protein
MPQSTLETTNELVAGSFGGAAQVLVGQPLDTFKTRARIAPSSVHPPSPIPLCVRLTTSPRSNLIIEDMFVSAISASMPVFRLNPLRRKGPRTYWCRPHIQRAFRYLVRLTAPSSPLTCLLSTMNAQGWPRRIAGVNSLLLSVLCRLRNLEADHLAFRTAR